MKKLIFAMALVGATGFMMNSCGNSTGSGSEIDSLRTVAADQENQLKEAEMFIELMGSSMDSVLFADGNTILQVREGQVPNREKVKANLEAYKRLLEENRAKIEELQKALANEKSASSKKMAEIVAKLSRQIEAKDSIIGVLQKQIEDKNFDISRLTEHVASLMTEVKDLSEENALQSEALAAQTDKMNEAYYIIASKAELKQKGIVSGGSLFKKSKLDMSNVDSKAFTKIDIRERVVFTIPSGNPKILTQAPASSYKLQKTKSNESVLTVTNVADFWSVNNYLVIQY